MEAEALFHFSFCILHSIKAVSRDREHIVQRGLHLFLARSLESLFEDADDRGFRAAVDEDDESEAEARFVGPVQLRKPLVDPRKLVLVERGLAVVPLLAVGERRLPLHGGGLLADAWVRVDDLDLLVGRQPGDDRRGAVEQLVVRAIRPAVEESGGKRRGGLEQWLERFDEGVPGKLVEVGDQREARGGWIGVHWSPLCLNVRRTSHVACRNLLW